MVIVPGLSQRSPSSVAPEVGWGAQLNQGDEGGQPVAQGGVVDCREPVLVLTTLVRACSGQKQDCWCVATLAGTVQGSETPAGNPFTIWV